MKAKVMMYLLLGDFMLLSQRIWILDITNNMDPGEVQEGKSAKIQQHQLNKATLVPIEATGIQNLPYDDGICDKSFLYINGV